MSVVISQTLFGELDSLTQFKLLFSRGVTLCDFVLKNGGLVRAWTDFLSGQSSK